MSSYLIQLGTPVGEKTEEAAKPKPTKRSKSVRVQVDPKVKHAGQLTRRSEYLQGPCAFLLSFSCQLHTHLDLQVCVPHCADGIASVLI